VYSLFYLPEPVFVSKPWGGEKFKDIYPSAMKSDIGEVWLLSGYPGKETPIFSVDGREYIPSKIVQKLTGLNLPRFPFLIKMLNATQWLSIQVHPDNSYAKKNESGEPWGKNELWYVLDAAADARIINGIKGIASKKEMMEVLESGAIEKHLNYTNLKKDDLIYVQAGKVHALGPDSLILEVQQTSDLTYRLYDWGRDRPMYMKKGSEVTNYRYPLAETKANFAKYRNDYFYTYKKDFDDEEVKGFCILMTLEEIEIDEFECRKYFPVIIPHNSSVRVTGSCIVIELGRWWTRHGCD
jgi:mannose-6-phosphate isomerase